MMPSIGYELPWPEMEKQMPKWKLLYGNEVAPTCPRCASANTKFCYYNNYSLSQPRYFCKGCRRYWTKGGSLRNIPVGGGCRKSRRRLSNNDRRFARTDSRISERNNSNPDEEFRVNPSSDGSDIDLAAVFAKFVNDNNQSPSSTGNSATGFDQESPVTTDALDLESLNWDIGQETEAVFGFYEQFNLTQKIADGDSDQLIRHDQGAMEQGMFDFQSLIDDRDIQELLNYSFPDNLNQFNYPASFLINDDRSSSDLPGFGI